MCKDFVPAHPLECIDGCPKCAYDGLPRLQRLMIENSTYGKLGEVKPVLPEHTCRACGHCVSQGCPQQHESCPIAKIAPPETPCK